MIRILIADSHELMREGLKHIFQKAQGITVVGEAATAHETLQIVRDAVCDLILVELAMPGRSGVELVRQVRNIAPRLPILVLTGQKEEAYACRVIRAGANGYLMKTGPSRELVHAIRKVASGRPYISADVAEQLVLDLLNPTEPKGYQSLSDREQQVFMLLANGASITDVATALHLSVKTVSTHKKRIMARMNFSSFSELVQYAIAHGLIKNDIH